MNKGMKLGKTELEYAITGGTILGGGGGGHSKKGRKYAEVAVQYSDLYLQDIGDLRDDELLITASLVGAPNAPNQYITPQHLVRCVELLKENNDLKIGGIITNENGGEATVNGWIQAAVLGIPLIDAPCNGRAHPTGVMGSMNLHKLEGYTTMQVAVGGNPETGNHIECLFRGSIEHTSKLVRLASIEAGGLVGVARNPVTVGYAKKNNAIGGITHAIKTGEVFCKGLETSPERAVSAAMEFLGGSVVAKGVVKEYAIRGEGGFDVGHARVDDLEMTFWNEYMTLERGSERFATFPDLIMTFDCKTGEPLTTAMLKPQMEVYVATTSMENLCLASTMQDRDLIEQVEDIVGKEMLRYLRVK